jgi:hypothetical protein
MKKSTLSLALWGAGLRVHPIVSDFLPCRKVFKNSPNFWQKILDYFISTISSRSFPFFNTASGFRLTPSIGGGGSIFVDSSLQFKNAKLTNRTTINKCRERAG